MNTEHSGRKRGPGGDLTRTHLLSNRPLNGRFIHHKAELWRQGGVVKAHLQQPQRAILLPSPVHEVIRSDGVTVTIKVHFFTQYGELSILHVVEQLKGGMTNIDFIFYLQQLRIQIISMKVGVNTPATALDFEVFHRCRSQRAPAPPHSHSFSAVHGPPNTQPCTRYTTP